MGEVYRARDTRLGRTVAIKVLPERLSQKSDLRQRMENEARTISSFRIPTFARCTTLGITRAWISWVLEFVEGENTARTDGERRSADAQNDSDRGADCRGDWRRRMKAAWCTGI